MFVCLSWICIPLPLADSGGFFIHSLFLPPTSWRGHAGVLPLFYPAPPWWKYDVVGKINEARRSAATFHAIHPPN